MIIISLVFSILYLSALLYLFIKNPKDIKKILSFLAGIILTAVINLIIWQPTLKTEVLQKLNRSPVLLIDKSLSMSQFNSDSILQSLRSEFKDLKKIRVFTFGESCKSEDIKDIKFIDSTSLFPENFIQDNMHSTIILISDALFQNLPDSKTLSQNSQMYYTPLKRMSYSNHITISHPLEINQTGSKKTAIDIEISGYSKDSLNQLTLKLFSNDKELNSKVINYSTGNIYLTKSMNIPQLTFGRHLLTLKAFQNNSLIQSKELVVKSTPEDFKINISSNSPSLDERFIRLAIKKNEYFKISDTYNSDISIIFNEKTKSKSSVNLYILNNTPLFNLKENTIALSSNEPNFMNFSSLPKPQRLYQSAMQGKAVITGIIDDKKIPVLTQFIGKKNISLHLNVAGFWKWDFRDQYPTNNISQLFTSSLLDYLKESSIKSKLSEPLVIKTDLSKSPLSNTYTIYHPFSDPSGNNFLNFTFLDKKGNKVFNRQKKLNTLLEKDTIIINTERDYTSCLFDLNYGNKTFNIEKKTTSNNVNPEISTSDQNELFLNKFFHKLDITDSEMISQILNKDYESKNITITKEFNFHRNWYLLITAILLLTVFWAIKQD